MQLAKFSDWKKNSLVKPENIHCTAGLQFSGLDATKQEIMLLFAWSKVIESKPVKLKLYSEIFIT